MKLFRNKEQKKKEAEMQHFFKVLETYRPAFTSFEGGMYEMDLTRAAIHSFATHVTKLKPQIKGSGNQALERILQFQPNPLQDATKFLYRLATIFQMQNNAFIVPLKNGVGDITGFLPVLPSSAEIKEYQGEHYFVYTGLSGTRTAIPYGEVGLLNQFYYRDEVFGESNKAMGPTLELLNTQNQGIVESVKASASIRFIAKLATALKSEALEEERKRLVESNLNISNQGGIMLFDQKYEDIKQIDSKPYSVDPQQAKQIQENVFTYFGTNEAILQNRFNSEEWNAYYEGKIEPFAIQLSLVLTNLLFSEKEKAFGNQVIFSANRLQHMSNNEKLTMVTQLFDRGFITHNEGLEIFNMPSIGEVGNKRFIRKEYAESIETTQTFAEVKINEAE